MPNDQFRIPDEFIETPPIGGEVRDAIEQLYAQPTQEVLEQEPRPVSIQAIEYSVDLLRREKLHENDTQKSAVKWLRNVASFKPATPITQESLLTQESYAAGKIFGEGVQFWLHLQDNNATHRDWYVSSQQSNGTSEVLHYMTTPETIYKFHNANEKPFIEGEVERFIYATNLYHSQVSKAVYGKQSDYDLVA